MKKQVNIFDYTSGVKYLEDYFEEMKTVNPRVSLRALATKLGLDQSTLSRYFGGERHISSEKASELGPKLKLNATETHYLKLLFLFGDRGETELLEKLKLSFLYDREIRQFAKDGQPFLENISFVLDLKVNLIFEMQRLAETKSPEEILKILNKFFETDQEQVYQILNTLIARGFLDDANSERRQEIVKDLFVPTSQIPNKLGVKYHEDALKTGLKAFENFHKTDIEIQTCVVAIKKENRDKILKAMQHLSGLLTEYSVSEGADEVFLISSFMLNITSEVDRIPSKEIT